MRLIYKMPMISFEADIYLRSNQQGTIQYSTDSVSYLQIPSWPVTFNNTSNTNKNVKITNKLVMTNDTMYFIMGSNNITINGQSNIVEIQGVTGGYPGLVQNGNYPNPGYNNIIIQNLGVTATNGSILQNYAGWIGQANINYGAIGCQVRNCYSIGDISGIFAGGIFGAFSDGTATNCYSKGPISGQYSGGIFGFGAFSNGTATNCYSSGDISGPFAGGIFGNYSNGAATNCYSSGAITPNNNAGGIFGGNPFNFGTSCYIADRYWNDQTASSALSGAPIYFGSSLFQQGSIWIDVDTANSNVPFQLAPLITSTIPGAPTITGITPGNQTLSVAFTAPVNNGGATITDYTYTTDGSTYISAGTTSSPITITGLTNGTMYSVALKAVNSVGPGSVSNIVSATPIITAPGAPTITGITPGNQTLSVAFTAPVNNGGATIIDYTYTTNGSTYISAGTTSSPITITGLTNGTTYSVALKAVNSVGPGSVSNTVSVTLPINLSSDIYLRSNQGAIQYSTDNTFSTPTSISSWPCTFNNVSNPITNKTIYITNNLEMTTLSMYFIMGSSNITIDGQNNIVEINGVTGYPGLVQNGASSTNGYNNIKIKNLGVTATNSSTLANYAGGWIGQTYMNKGVGTTCQVTNCYSSGDISGNGSGGIFGSYSSGTATNCYSSGAINADNAGGIFGMYSGGISTNCYSTGAIGYYGGGIFGRFSSGTATNCYSIGPISGQYSGGIFSSDSAGTATNCYSSGTISGQYAGGIFGPGSSGTATNCYSTGDISGTQAGGIFGASSSSSGTATNCYSSGTISVNSGGIFSTYFSSGTATKCYSAYGSWNDQTAIANLTGVPTYSGSSLIQQGTVWIDIDKISQNTPWLLKSFFTLASFSLLPLSVNERELYSGSLTSSSLYSGSLTIDSPNSPQYTILSQPIDNLYISGNTVKAKYPFYYREYQTYPVQISGTVSGITIVNSFNIQIVNLPDAPTLVYISNNKIPENSSIDSLVGTLNTSDPDVGDTFTYQFASGAGSADNSSFTIEGNILYTSTALNYNTKNTYSIRVKTTDSSGLSVENPILLYVILPTAGSFETSGLVGSTTTITLRGQNIAGGALVYQIIQQPAYGSLDASGSTVIYVPNSNTADSFEYVVKEDTMTSLPGRVIIYNYNQNDIANIPKTLGTLEVDNISFDGNRWTIGPITTDIFIQGPSFYKLGTMTLTN